MAYRTWQIEHRGEFWLALRRATSLPRGNKLDYVSYKTLVRWRFACALRGSARGFWFIHPLGLRPRGLCTVATRACHVNHAPPSYNYNMSRGPFDVCVQIFPPYAVERRAAHEGGVNYQLSAPSHYRTGVAT